MKIFVHSDGTLILVTVISVLIIALIVGNAYIPILMGGELFSESFKERNLAPQNLSRTLEDAGTCSIPLVPWSAGGAYMSGTLGVSTFAYAPWVIFCYYIYVNEKKRHACLDGRLRVRDGSGIFLPEISMADNFECFMEWTGPRILFSQRRYQQHGWDGSFVPFSV